MQIGWNGLEPHLPHKHNSSTCRVYVVTAPLRLKKSTSSILTGCYYLFNATTSEFDISICVPEPITACKQEFYSFIE